MARREDLLHEIESIPEPLPRFRILFAFLRARAQARVAETALASESLLAREWLTPEEDEAWRDL